MGEARRIDPAERLDGAAAIASYLRKTERWVYQARERGWSVPIRKQDGMGIYAFKFELDAWQLDDDSLPARRSA